MSDLNLTRYMPAKDKTLGVDKLATNIGLFNNPLKEGTPEVIEIDGKWHYKLDKIEGEMAFYERVNIKT